MIFVGKIVGKTPLLCLNSEPPDLSAIGFYNICSIRRLAHKVSQLLISTNSYIKILIKSNQDTSSPHLYNFGYIVGKLLANITKFFCPVFIHMY
jgi:hypothetical protein